LSGFAYLPFRTRRVGVRKRSLRNLGVPSGILSASRRRHTVSFRCHLPSNFPSAKGSYCSTSIFPGCQVLFQLWKPSAGR
jgi:hypothetical protein